MKQKCFHFPKLLNIEEKHFPHPSSPDFGRESVTMSQHLADNIRRFPEKKEAFRSMFTKSQQDVRLTYLFKKFTPEAQIHSRLEKAQK